MNILAIETSCDETGIAVLCGEKTSYGHFFTVIADALLSQAALHTEYGGVYPTLAKREHQKNLPILLEQAAGIAPSLDTAMDAVAVTTGPGLEPALWSGITFAQALAHTWQKPLFGVNHMEGHLISSLCRRDSHIELSQRWVFEDTAFPLLALLVSGGHTQFVASDSRFSYRILGDTLDDAVGEAFDKVARMLGLSYPGGPNISRLAEIARTSSLQKSPVKLPRPMITRNTCDVSFSGLKTAALYALRNMGGIESLSEANKAAFAREFEDAVTDVLLTKTRRAMQESSAHTFVLGGGVAGNTHLRMSLARLMHEEFPRVRLQLPDPSITGDNAVMIGQAALLHLLDGDWNLAHPPIDLSAQGGLSLA